MLGVSGAKQAESADWFGRMFTEVVWEDGFFWGKFQISHLSGTAPGTKQK